MGAERARFAAGLAAKVGRIAGHIAYERLRPSVPHTRADVPRTPDDVTPEYLTSCLCAGHPEARVERIENLGGSSHADLLVGNDGGIWKYSGASNNWTDLNNNLDDAELTAISVSSTDPGQAIAESLNSGAEIFNELPEWSYIEGGTTSALTASRRSSAMKNCWANWGRN